MTTNPPDKSPDRITPGKPLEPVGTTPQAPTKDFSSYMQGGTSPQAPVTGPGPATTQPSPTAPPSLSSIQQSAGAMQDSLGNVSQQLQTKGLKLKRSQTHLLKNKLTDAQNNIRQATSKLGIESPPMTMPTGGTAMDRFLAYVNDGQDQLIQVQQKLKDMASKGQQLNAAEMLTITVKMNLAQQEIEYSSTLLGKVIDSMKQMMNIQL